MVTKVELRRLHQMELLLRWEGHIGNQRLRDLFGLSVTRASEWLKEFRELNPYWTRWNSVMRRFEATPTFYQFAERDMMASLGQYLTLTGLPTAMDASPQDVIVAAFPDITPPSPKIFADLSEAARTGCAVEILYRSMRNPSPHPRKISPHSIIHAGRRWHVRAYCELNKDFRDYALGRISDVVIAGPASCKKEADSAWMTEVPIRLVAHPELSLEQGSLIRFEYFHNTSARVTTCRGALVNYFIQDVRAAIDIRTQRPPEYQLAVQNFKEVLPWLFPA